MISVVLPVFNREQTVERAVLSVLNQTYSDLELIVVDDCSLDRTGQIVKSISDNRVKYYRLEANSGACVARNYGIKKAEGDFIAFQDSDDEWETDKLEKQEAYLRACGGDIVFCGLKVFEDGVFKKIAPRFLRGNKKVSYDELLENPVVSTQTLFGKKECFTDIEFDPMMPRFQDWDIALRLAKKYDLYFLDEPLVRLNVQADSISRDNNKGIIALEKIYEKNKKEIKKNRKAYANYYIMRGNLERRKDYFVKALWKSRAFSVILRVGRSLFRRQ